MPLRVARYHELCRVCGEKTESHCFRCKAPLCAAHEPAADSRCELCEREFKRWPSREPAVIGFGGAMIAAWVALTVVLFDVSVTGAVLWALLYPAAVGIAAHRELRSGRPVFLAQEKRTHVPADSRRLLQ